MLEFYLDSGFKMRQLRECPVGAHMDSFADWLQTRGYKRRPAQLTLRGAAHFACWASTRDIPIGFLDETVVDSFSRHVPTCICPHPFRGRNSYHMAGARRLVEHLQNTGFLSSTRVEPETVSLLISGFSDWMRYQRGTTESTLVNYIRVVKKFLFALGEDTAAYDAGQVRAFIFTSASRSGYGHAKSVVNATRMFLRFLAVYGYCLPKLIESVPGIACWKLSSLPRYISADDVDRLVAVCDPATPSGSRDRAVILLLARLGLRAADVRDLRLGELDWSQGKVRVMGKGRCETQLPLPQDAGDAILHYLSNHRPAIDDEHVFLRVYAPITPLPSSGPISKLVRRAILRAGVKAPSMGAHVLRHSAATEMLRQGASLDVIGAVLRHRRVDTTAHYAKVDIALLRSVLQPWPDDGGVSC